ncbi:MULTISPECIES: DEAD/DEAH box helicase family protein [Paenarthrobacter]|uniref:DEAD/DEAH box helicase family protein n=1 Tax=Paenarthrobacter ureafaciens TaxID=37931 RepID=A0AAX3EPX9_PAEUR|nr:MULTISPECIES: DEAD/DEAH box helicase family protein [Paenarthrobacter]NKR12641.1 hypothetical protein [Arthrobacter sp. M5]NKR16514.1 hypothetical protein [Arthrobacter sp. M6]OEH60109.1 hypothetical protein A5N17_17405 [Arthrobacter sp. D2]OEH63745.1 hypothetical protein A5N13_14050 [Arthrobacter sp. D4]MDO5878275.1 DEAD/DEAH box helicase family protein [Paenarthrobacter sp. SD-1]
MRFTLKDYQEIAAAELVQRLKRATDDVSKDAADLWSLVLSAPTGAGKTVIATAVIETLFHGNGQHDPDPLATILWVTDDPALNEQTKRKMKDASASLGRFITIDAGFDQQYFEPGIVHFLNIQKLSRTNQLSRSDGDKRDYSLWETITNTIKKRQGHFYVIIDEAHKGMQREGDHSTIIKRIINGQTGSNLPAPIVVGISATPQRFQDAVGTSAISRSTRDITVPISEVRGSGLLKDVLALDNPKESQQLGDTTLVRLAVDRVRTFEDSWNSYSQSQGESPVVPVLVVQVKNTPTDADMSELLSTIFDAWPGLKDVNVVNVFGEHQALSVNGRVVRYIRPEEIQDDVNVRVVICKDAISTGWDCPRAEVLISFRKAKEYTYIAQLIGRMVRTPLARRIPTDQTLNAVSCYLPYFNEKEVDSIARRFEAGENDEPPITVVTNAVDVGHNADVPDEVFDLLEQLPTYTVPGKIYKTQVSRLFRLAALLNGHSILDTAVKDSYTRLLGILDAARTRLMENGQFEKMVERLRTLDIERQFVNIGTTTFDWSEDAKPYAVILDDHNVDDLFQVATRKLPEGLANEYWSRAVREDDVDPFEAKAEVAALALDVETVAAVEAAAEQQVQFWLSTYQRSINQLNDSQKDLYEPIRRQAKSAELTSLSIPLGKTVSGDNPPVRRHVLADNAGNFPVSLKGWEAQVVERELKDDNLVAWYRNPTGGPSALRIPYEGPDRAKPMYPDFIMFHRYDDGLKPSIIDPHGDYLEDAAAKLKGLAQYAEKHALAYARIESVIENDQGVLRSLDLKSAAVRQAILAHQTGSVATLFAQHGGNYS